jgi:hypothetical protein
MPISPQLLHEHAHANARPLIGLPRCRTRAPLRVARANAGLVECVVPAADVPIGCEPAAVKRAPRMDYDAKFSGGRWAKGRSLLATPEWI